MQQLAALLVICRLHQALLGFGPKQQLLHSPRYVNICSALKLTNLSRASGAAVL
jgi:hypothetical protein